MYTQNDLVNAIVASVRQVGYNEALTFDVSRESDSVTFNWKKHTFRVTSYGAVYEIVDNLAVGNALSDLMEMLIKTKL